MPKSEKRHRGYKFLSDLCLGAWDLVTASRQKIGMVLTFMTLTLSAATVIGMAFDRDLNPLQRYNQECRQIYLFHHHFKIIVRGKTLLLCQICHLLSVLFTYRDEQFISTSHILALTFSACALQASFGLISVGSGIQFLLFFFLLYQFFKARHNKHRVDEYHLNVSANALSSQ